MILAVLVACGPGSAQVPTMDGVAPVTSVTPEPPPTLDLFEELQGGPTVEIEIDEASLDLLREWPRDYVDAQVTLLGEERSARVRLKGNGSFQPVDLRPSLKIKLDEPLHGIETLVLNNGISDPTRAHALLARQGFELLDLPVARAAPVWVELAGFHRGAYTLVEDVDERMLERWFEPDGSLYELFDGDFQRGMLEGLTLEEGPPRPEVLFAISDDLALGDVAGFDIAMDHFDRDRFFDFWATTALVGQTDAYPYARPGDDVYIHIDAEGQVTLIPHGLDEAFLPRDRVVGDTAGLLARRCLALESCRSTFRRSVNEVADRLLALGFEDLQEDAVLETQMRWSDPRFLSVPSIADQEHLGELADWLPNRRAQLMQELAP